MWIRCSSKPVQGALTFGNPDSAGVPAAYPTQHTLVLPFNDVNAVKAAFTPPTKIKSPASSSNRCQGNAGLYLPQPGYLEFLREITRSTMATPLLIFDEVMTGFPAQRRAGRKELFKLVAGFDLHSVPKSSAAACRSARSAAAQRSWICSRHSARFIRRER